MSENDNQAASNCANELQRYAQTNNLSQLPANTGYAQPYPNFGYWGGTCPSCGYCKCCGRSNGPYFQQGNISYTQTTGTLPGMQSLNNTTPSNVAKGLR